MTSITIVGKKLSLGSRSKRLYAFMIDLVLLSVVSLILGSFLGAFLPFSYFLSEPLSSLFLILGLLFIDGFQKGRGIGKQLLSLQVLRVKDGQPCTYKDAFVRNFAGLILQPFDLLWLLGAKRQRLGDKFASTVVVNYEPQPEQMKTKTEGPEDVLENVIAEMKHLFLEGYRRLTGKVDGQHEPDPKRIKPKTENPEDVLANAIAEMRNRLSEAREKVDASIGVEKQFQDAYEGAVMQADQWQERALISLKAGREDLAREDLKKRNEYQQLADQHKTQWEEQKQIVRSLNERLEHLQQKITEAQRQQTVALAKHRNVDAETYLQEMLEELEENKAFETLAEIEQDATETSALAKAATEVDVAYQAAKLEREFSDYAEEASLDKDLAELKTKLQK